VTFERINYGGTINVVDAAKEAGVKRILYQSALGARPDPSLPYFDTKYRAEQYLQQSGLSFAILRPSARPASRISRRPTPAGSTFWCCVSATRVWASGSP
jgi:uncharacterized protein YbjT (DUF2867 family)